MSRLLLISSLFLTQIAKVSAQEQPQHIVVQNPLLAAAQLIDAGYIEQAQAILTAIDQLSEADREALDATEIEFLRGRLAYAQKNYQTAIEVFRGILYDQPELTRVRLELARAYYDVGKNTEAEDQFKYTLGGNLPETTTDNVISFLQRIDDAKLWRYRFDISIAPDSNINTATDVETVELFGLPFSLSDEAQAKSGVGVRASGGVEFRPSLGDKIRLKSGVSLQRTEYSGDSFDGTIISGFIGPQFNFQRSSLHVRANVFRRWFGLDGFNYGVGGVLDYRRRITPKLEGTISLSSQEISYDKSPVKDGLLLSLNIQARYAKSATSIFGLSVGINESNAKAAHEESTAYRMGASLSQKLPHAFSLRLMGDITVRNFDAINPSFAVKRADELYSLNIELIKRDVIFFGMRPVFRFAYTLSKSNINFFNYSRFQSGFGLVRLF